LGYVAAVWAALEFQINDAIWQLANIPQDAGACMTAQIVAIGGRTRAYAAMADLRGANDKKLTKKINAYSQHIEGLARQRNRAVHDPWSVNTLTGSILRLQITADKKLEFGFKAVELQELNSLYDQIIAANEEFAELHSHVMAVARPLPRTHYEQSQRIRLVRVRSEKSSARKAPSRPQKSSQA
jgi:hypothetical protein